MPTENSLYGNDSFSVLKRQVNLAKSLSIRCILVLACLMMNSVGTAYANNQLKAFACAQGFGATATGGRGGDVYHVTKLSDDGSRGTLRHAINSASGPRTVVFDIGGIIKLNSRLKLKTDNITLAGQTAPGGGITLAGYPFDIVNRSDVIIRYIRFRVGDYNARDPDGGNNGKGNKNLGGAGGDAIFAENVNRLILDHISASWSMDESVDITQ
jgi:pectate lyase